MSNLKNSKPKIGLVLGGGGARGLAHIGVLKELEKEGIKPDLIVGVSMGALIGTYYALGMDLQYLEKEVISLNRRKALKEFFDVSNPKKGLIKGKKIEKYIRKFVDEKKFSDAKIPLYILATDLANGEEVILKKGDLIQAMRASISVPGIFPPVKIKDRYLVDGGVVNSTPVNIAKDLGADFIIAVDLITKRQVKLEKPGIISTLVQSYEIIRSKGVWANIEKAGNSFIVIKPPLRGAIDSFKFYNIGKFIETGRAETEKEMPKIKREINKIKK